MALPNMLIPIFWTREQFSWVSLAQRKADTAVFDLDFSFFRVLVHDIFV